MNLGLGEEVFGIVKEGNRVEEIVDIAIAKFQSGKRGERLER